MVQIVTSDSSEEPQVKEEITLDVLAHKLDIIGQQTDWMVENLTQLFGFVSAMGQSGGGIRGAMKMLKELQSQGEQPNAG